MEFMERLEKSNQEMLIVDKTQYDLKNWLVINKIMTAKRKMIAGKQLGFFKLTNGKLEVHICIQKDEKEKPEWYRFNVLDANEEEIEKNQRLNIFKTEVRG